MEASEILISFIVGAAASALISAVIYFLQKKTDTILVSATELHSQSLKLIEETQELHSLRTAILRNQQDIQTEILKAGEHVSHHIKEQIENLVLSTNHPDFFVSTKTLNLTPPSNAQDPDTPVIGDLIINNNVISHGERVGIMFRVNDEKWNFSVPSGAAIHHPGGILTPNKVTAKYMSFEIIIPAKGSQCPITFLLIDEAGNQNTQKITIPINPTHK
ncbi:hypothetical protein [Pseudomonas caricapapayae]|uniref:hypothetical protein n=1 Tax=Pseudomonas caricapapayae TaxID=46678 RepID=UPI0006D5DD24|nr:hypothetical protein [Pseudomonas caricapapayae]KAA8693955.1 hypothetical protein F4W67_18955 [Pseudomonas caricapapayae]